MVVNMKTMHKLIAKFKRMYPEYDAYLDPIDSYKGNYRVAITEPVLDLTAWYTFTSCREFNEWINGVVLD